MITVMKNTQDTGAKTVPLSPGGLDLLSRGREIFTASSTMRLSTEERWGKSNDLYDAKFSPEDKSWSDFLGQPRLFIAKTYAQIQRILEEVLETLFFDFEELASVAPNKAVDEMTLEIWKTIINHRLNGNPINYYEECHEAVLDAIKNKIAIFKVYPRLKKKKVSGKRQVIKENGEPDPGKFEDAEIEVVDRWAPSIECIPYEDVFFHPSATWKDYWKYPIIHRKRVTIEYCRLRGFNLASIEALQGAGTANSTGDQIKQQRAEKTGSPFSAPVMVKQQNEIWIFECWDYLPSEKNGDLEGCSYILGGSTSQDMAYEMRGREQNNLPYEFDPLEPCRPPIIAGCAFPESHQLYGKDFPEFTEGLQKETNSQRNQEREEVARRLRTPLLVNNDANLDIMALTIRRVGGVVRGENIGPDAVRELISPPPSPVTQNFQARTDMDYAEISSLPPLSVGVPTKGVGSATEFAGLDRNANKKIKGIIRNLAVTLFIPSLRYIARLEQAYESDEFIEFVTGQKLGRRFEKDEKGLYKGAPPSLLIQGFFDFTVNLGIDKDTQVNRLRTLIELGNQANANAAQMLQFQVAKPEDVKFFNVGWAFEKIARLIGQKDTAAMFFNGKNPPPPPEGGKGAATPGQASPPRIADPTSAAQGNFLA